MCIDNHNQVAQLEGHCLRSTDEDQNIRVLPAVVGAGRRQLKIPRQTLDTRYYRQICVTHGTPNDEDSLLLSLNPLNDFVCALSQRIAACRNASNAVQFKHWSDPCEGSRRTNAVMNFDMRMLGMNACVQDMISGEEPSGR